MRNGGNMFSYFTSPVPRDNDLNRILAEFVHNIINQVESFLIRQTGYHSDHHHMRIPVKPQLFLQSRLIEDLILTEIFNREVLCNPGCLFPDPQSS